MQAEHHLGETEARIVDRDTRLAGERNLKPAADALHDIGFTNVKALYFADNIATNWRDKGYPTVKGE